MYVCMYVCMYIVCLYYSAIKRNEFMKFLGKWLNLEVITFFFNPIDWMFVCPQKYA
jgi:hypothetical protein